VFRVQDRAGDGDADGGLRVGGDHGGAAEIAGVRQVLAGFDAGGGVLGGAVALEDGDDLRDPGAGEGGA